MKSTSLTPLLVLLTATATFARGESATDALSRAVNGALSPRVTPPREVIINDGQDELILTARPCGYDKTCYHDRDGLLRLWTQESEKEVFNGAGRAQRQRITTTHLAHLSARQKRYNAWVNKMCPHPNKVFISPSICLIDSYGQTSGRNCQYHMPAFIPDTGRFDTPTLKIDIYIRMQEALMRWDRLLQDASQLSCPQTLSPYTAMSTCSFQGTDALRATALAKAYNSLRAAETRIDSLGTAPSRWLTLINDRDMEPIPAGLFSDLAALDSAASSSLIEAALMESR